MNKNCEIVKDLLPSYLYGILSDESQKFVTDHLKDCDSCKMLLEKMKSETNFNDTQQEEIDYLKKYKKKMNIIKSFLFSILGLFIFICLILIINYVRIHQINQKVIVSIEEMKSANNYMLSISEHQIDYEHHTDNVFTDIYYYKDGKYRKDSDFESLYDDKEENDGTYTYGEIDSNQRIIIDENRKTLYYETTNIPFVKKGQFLMPLSNQTFSTSFGDYVPFELRYNIYRKDYQGKSCFVIEKKDERGFFELWIDKETMLPVRRIENEYNRYYHEINYTFSLEKVTDEMLEIPAKDGYEEKHITNKIDKSTLTYYERLRE